MNILNDAIGRTMNVRTIENIMLGISIEISDIKTAIHHILR